MIKLELTTTSKFVTSKILLAWTTDIEYDWYQISYRYSNQENWVILVDFFKGKEYSFYPPKIKGKIYIKVAGFKRNSKQNILIIDEDKTTLFIPSTIESTTHVLSGNYSILSQDRGITCGVFDGLNKSIIAISREEKKYKINPNEEITLNKKNQDEIINEFIDKTKNKTTTYTLPIETEYNPTYLSFIDNSGIEFHHLDIEKDYLSYFPQEVKKLSNQFVIKEIDKKGKNLVLSQSTPDSFYTTKTDKNGKYTTEKVFKPGRVSLSLGKNIVDFDEEKVSDYLYFTYDKESKKWIGVEAVEGFYFNPKNYYSGVVVEDRDLRVDFTIPKEPLIVDYGKVITKTKRLTTDEILSGVPISISYPDETKSLITQNTSESGISLFELPVGSYNVKILSSGLGYERWKFEPAIETIELSSGQTIEILSYGEPYYSISGRVRNQLGNTLPENVDIEIRNTYTDETLVLSTNDSYDTSYNLTDGSYRVTSLHIPSYPSYYDVEIAGDDVVVKDFIIPTNRVSGIVVELDGSGVEKAEVSIYKGLLDEPKIQFEKDKIVIDEGSPFYTVKTGRSGLYIADLFEGDYTLRATKTSYNLNDIVDWLKDYLGLDEGSELILLLRQYQEETSKEEQETLTKEIIDILKENGLEIDVTGSLNLSGGLVKYYFQPLQRQVSLYDRDVGGQDFFREDTYSISGRFINGRDTTNGLSGIDFYVLTNNERLLYTQSYYRFGGVEFSDSGYGVVGKTKSTPNGNYYVTSLLPGNYIIVPAKIVEEYVYNEEEKIYEWQQVWDSVEGRRRVFNYGYLFTPDYQARRLSNSNIYNLNFYGYTSVVSGIVLDVNSSGIEGVKEELIGGEYEYEYEEGEDGGGSWVIVPKQAYTDCSGVAIFKHQKPNELYQLHFFKEVNNHFYYYQPNDVSKRISLTDLDFICYTTGIEFTHNYISGKVIDASGIPIKTEVIAIDGIKEQYSIVKKETSEEPSYYYFTGIVDNDGFYTIETLLPGSYTVFPRSYSYKYEPTSYTINNIDVDNKSGLDFVGDMISEGSEEKPPIDLPYYASGRVYNVWNNEGVSGIEIIGIKKSSITKQYTTVTQSGGGFTLYTPDRDIYYIYPKTENLYYPPIPYVVNLNTDNKSGIDFGLIEKHKIYGEVKYTTGEPISDLPLLFNQSYSRVSIIDRSGVELFSYDKDLYKPLAKHNPLTGELVIVNTGKHNLLVLSGSEVTWSMGDFTSGNSIPGKPDFKWINYPIDLETYYNGDIKLLNYISRSGITISKGNNTTDIFTYKDKRMTEDRYSASMLYGNENFTLYSDNTAVTDDFINPDENNERVESILGVTKFVGRTSENEDFLVPTVNKLIKFDVLDYIDVLQEEDIKSLDLKDFTFVLRNKYTFVKDKKNEEDMMLE